MELVIGQFRELTVILKLIKYDFDELLLKTIFYHLVNGSFEVKFSYKRKFLPYEWKTFEMLEVCYRFNKRPIWFFLPYSIEKTSTYFKGRDSPITIIYNRKFWGDCISGIIYPDHWNRLISFCRKYGFNLPNWLDVVKPK